MDIAELAKQKVEEIKKALQEGRRVWLGRTQVKSIEMVQSPTGRSYIIIVNGEKAIYLSNFIRHEVRIE
jgi:S-adenosylmethionine:tRNA-ribosyltransferase-isomerase (queuine synthetase)